LSNPTIALLQQRLAQLEPISISIEDESHLHAGHAGAREGGHFKLHIISAAFKGKSTVARHRLIYDAAGDLMRGKIHALSIIALPPEHV
jgi:BolA protein